MERNKSLDIAKGILIILLVVHHIVDVGVRINALDNNVLNFVSEIQHPLILCYFMPAFFIISGICSNFDMGFRSFIKKQFKYLILPAISFTSINFFIYFFSGDEVNYIKQIGGLFIYGGEYWFLVALFLSKVICYLIFHITSRNLYKLLILIILSLGGVLIYNYDIPNLFVLEQTLDLCVYLGLGHLYKEKLINVTNSCLLKCLGLYIIIVLIFLINEVKLPYVTYGFGTTPLTWPIHLLLSVSGTIIIIGISKQIRHSNLLNYLGKNSLYIYLTQWIVINSLISLFMQILIDNTLIYSSIIFVSIIVVTLSVGAFISKIFNDTQLCMLVGKKRIVFTDAKVQNTPPRPLRSSNLELYRIICMFMIAIGHYVHNSGLLPVMENSPWSINSIYLYIIGMWGKVGINCFVLITGYFMCKGQITLRKFVKLLAWIYTYKIIIFLVFLLAGFETMSFPRIIKLLMPVWGFHSNFTSCFIVFWLTIPFWNILINNMCKKQHETLLILLVVNYTILASIPKFRVSFNYITWFGVLYLIASYIRLYPRPLYKKNKVWLMASAISIFLGILSMIMMIKFVGPKYVSFFLIDSNKIISVMVAVSTFMWFLNIDIKYNKLINMIGASTFGVLLIHANSDAMRQWLWCDVVNCVGNYSLPIVDLIQYSIGTVLVIYIICIIIDIIRIKFIEVPFFKWYDAKYIQK